MPAPVSRSQSAAWIRPPVMSVWRLGRTRLATWSIWRMKPRFCSLAVVGRLSKVTRARMSFSLKLPESIRATARESPAVSSESR